MCLATSRLTWTPYHDVNFVYLESIIYILSNGIFYYRPRHKGDTEEDDDDDDYNNNNNNNNNNNVEIQWI
jgi:hypothetical protein